MTQICHINLNWALVYHKIPICCITYPKVYMANFWMTKSLIIRHFYDLWLKYVTLIFIACDSKWVNGHINCSQHSSTDSKEKNFKKINQNHLKMPIPDISLMWLRPKVTQKRFTVQSVLISVTKMIEFSNKRHVIEKACKKFLAQPQ